MKKLICLVATMLMVAGISHLQAKNLQAYLSYSTFNSPAEGPYIETYLSVFGQSVYYVRGDNGKFQGTIEITIIFRQGDEIVDFAKYEVQSPEVEDTTAVNFSFIDQQRYLLSNGKYNMEVIIADKNGSIEPYITTEPVEINYPKDAISISDIELVESYYKTETQSILTRGGYDFIPYIFSFFPQTVTKLKFYAEIYNSTLYFGEDSKFLVSSYIESFETGQTLKAFQRNKRETSNTVLSVFHEFDIGFLPSGNYNLVVEARDRNNESIIKKKLFFQRSNPNIEFDLEDLAAVDINNSFVYQFTDPDTLRQFIKFLYPISTEMERVFMKKYLRESNLETMQQYFLNFWKTRNPVDPRLAWENYLIEVNKVNASFSTPNTLGYATERGRVYLKYGAPNIISESYNEPAAYPYEIWQYYTLGETQRNKRFVFFTHDIVTNDFVLVHSDAIGEPHDYRWQVVVYRRTFDPYNLDVDRYPNTWGSNVHQYWENPY